MLLDLDGTLIDSEPWHQRAEIEAFAQLGIELTEADIEPFVGTTLPHMLEGLNRRFGSAVTPEEFRRFGQPLLERYVQNDVELFSDVEPLLDRLDGVPMMVVTSSMRWYVEAVWKRFPRLANAFPDFVCQADVVHGKPNPEGYLLAADRLGLLPGQCLAIEDSSNGVAAAQAAGCVTIGIDREGHGRLLAASRVVRSLAEIRLTSLEAPPPRGARSARWRLG